MCCFPRCARKPRAFPHTRSGRDPRQCKVTAFSFLSFQKKLLFGSRLPKKQKTSRKQPDMEVVPKIATRQFIMLCSGRSCAGQQPEWQFILTTIETMRDYMFLRYAWETLLKLSLVVSIAVSHIHHSMPSTPLRAFQNQETHCQCGLAFTVSLPITIVSFHPA